MTGLQWVMRKWAMVQDALSGRRHGVKTVKETIQSQTNGEADHHMEDAHHNDQPIAAPHQDRFGIDPFARALASSIRNLKSPRGSVIGLNGPWGSGKSSAVNLVLHHLASAIKGDEIVVINFTCWWFRGEEALALAFFRELYSGMAPSLGDRLRKLLPKLGARLLRAGSALGGAVDAAGAGGVGAAAGGAMEWLASLIEQDEGVEELHRELSKSLADQSKRFLIIIDDIDRLSPDEALLIFRLVKSVGRLPNVIYLLVYDRQLAEKIVAARYPSEGPHYLEKIVQAAFELPEPDASDVQRLLLDSIGSICVELPDDRALRFMNIFHDGVAPAMRTPRDVARFANSLSVTWPAVAEEVDIGDFVALETLRLLHPATYRAVRQNKELLCRGRGGSDEESRENRSRRVTELLMVPEAEAKQPHLRRLLMRVFPILESIWSNVSYGDGTHRLWERERRVCSHDHFDTYFRFAIGDDAIPQAEIQGLIDHAGDSGQIARALRDAVAVTRKADGTRAALLIDALNSHAEQIPIDKAPAFLSGLFSAADDVTVDADASGAFSFVSNPLRLHWTLRSLLFDRTTLEERSAIIMQACDSASLAWLGNISSSAWSDYHPREGESKESPSKCLTTEADAERLRGMVRTRIESAAKDGSLLNAPMLDDLLHTWRQVADDEGAAVRAWTAAVCQTDEGVAKLCAAFTSYGWSQGMGGFGSLGDAVAQRKARVRQKTFEQFVDIESFKARVSALVAEGEFPAVQVFWDAWNRKSAWKAD